MKRSATQVFAVAVRTAGFQPAFLLTQSRPIARAPPHMPSKFSRARPSDAPRIRVTRETHDAPALIAERVARAGGTNRFGEPNFRVVWGGARLAWIGGRWTDRDAHGNTTRESVELRRVPKYLPEDRWHIERWMPPESYGSPEEWHRQTTEVEDGIRIAALGPYPSRGEYEHCHHTAERRGRIHAAHGRSVRLDCARGGMGASPAAQGIARSDCKPRSAPRARVGRGGR